MQDIQRIEIAVDAVGQHDDVIAGLQPKMSNLWLDGDIRTDGARQIIVRAGDLRTLHFNEGFEILARELGEIGVVVGDLLDVFLVA